MYEGLYVWGMLYADDSGIVSKSAEGLVKGMTVIVAVFDAAGLTVSETKTEAMLVRTPDQTSLAPPLSRHRSSRPHI